MITHDPSQLDFRPKDKFVDAHCILSKYDTSIYDFLTKDLKFEFEDQATVAEKVKNLGIGFANRLESDRSDKEIDIDDPNSEVEYGMASFERHENGNLILSILIEDYPEVVLEYAEKIDAFLRSDLSLGGEIFFLEGESMSPLPPVEGGGYDRGIQMMRKYLSKGLDWVTVFPSDTRLSNEGGIRITEEQFLAMPAYRVEKLDDGKYYVRLSSSYDFEEKDIVDWEYVENVAKIGDYLGELQQ